MVDYLQNSLIGQDMQKKEEYTVEYLRNILNYCDGSAYVNIIIHANGEQLMMPITSLLIHQTEDKKELISFVFDERETKDDL